jgi:FAD/FMN-containing dehydrogenase/Fe-S oxidoreductase
LGFRVESRADVAGLCAALQAAIRGEVRFSRLDRALYSTDASVYQVVPVGVVLPASEADVVSTLKVCSGFGVPLTARGGGTSQAGQAIGPGVVLDFSKYLNQILEINPAERWVRVLPGCVLDELNLALNPYGLQFAPDVSTSNRATIGGMIANNSCGAHSIVYGKTVDHVLALKVALANGTVVETGPLDQEELDRKSRQQDLEGACYRAVRELAEGQAAEIERRYPKILRRVGGYNLDLFTDLAPSRTRPFNLSHLFVGSEGTLGVILEARLRLVERPRAKALTVVHFAELLEALAATPAILEHPVSAVEVVDRYVLDSTRGNAEAARLRDFLQGNPGAILIVEFFGDRPEELPPRLDGLEADLRQRGFGTVFHRATDAAAQERVWKLRKMALGLSMSQKGDAKALSFVEDTAVAPEHLHDYIAEFLAVVAQHGTTAGVYAHASVGCLHVRPVVNLKTEAGVRQFESIAQRVADLVLKYGGSLSGEHGDGLVRSPFQEKMFGPALYGAFRQLKRTFDPQNLLNPGKIVDALPLAANLRYGPAYVTPTVSTLFDFREDGGIVQAAELCSGVGACRKRREGTMCPSYQATREEQHSTRGRANTLRLALTGQLGLSGLTDPDVRGALDLCLECKACKSECPTNVDLARLKAEFLYHYYRKHGLPWRNRIFGAVATWSSWGCSLTPVSNWMSRPKMVRWLLEKLLGIDGQRSLPAFARRRFTPKLCQKPAALGQRRVLLFPDTFAAYYQPEVAEAAVALLEHLNCVVVPGLLEDRQLSTQDGIRWPAELRCCGRPLISNGLLARAVAHATHNVRRLYPWAESGQPIIACEPSCILTVKDDYPALLRGEWRQKAETVAAACRTFEEFVDSLLPEQASLEFFQPGPKRILVQSHCHQRALVGVKPTLRLLRRIPGADVIDLDAGCCGMAGSFGYEKEHSEISRLVGEQRLFPAVRHAAADTVVVASGFSCRMQIKHFTNRTALHPAELLRHLIAKHTSPSVSKGFPVARSVLSS